MAKRFKWELLALDDRDICLDQKTVVATDKGARREALEFLAGIPGAERVDIHKYSADGRMSGMRWDSVSGRDI